MATTNSANDVANGAADDDDDDDDDAMICFKTCNIREQANGQAMYRQRLKGVYS